jgi:LPPG:FO 2-phospho-L-lactate transferase
VIAVLAGGVGAARFLAGLVRAVGPGEEVTAVVNTGDDLELHGLHVSPDVDTVTYTLAGLVDPVNGWGIAGDSFEVLAALEQLGAPTWFRLGDRDLATHLYRTSRLRSGASLSAVTAELAARRGVRARILPMSDDPVRTRVKLAGGEEVEFQEYFVRRQHAVAVAGVRYAGALEASPAPGVLEALTSAELVVVAPSNPVLSIGPILAVPGIADLLERRRQEVVAISPIVAGRALKGPAARLLVELGSEASVVGIARALRRIAGTLVVDEADADLAPAIEAEGVACVVTATVMESVEVAARLACAVLEAGAARA